MKKYLKIVHNKDIYNKKHHRFAKNITQKLMKSLNTIRKNMQITSFHAKNPKILNHANTDRKVWNFVDIPHIYLFIKVKLICYTS